MAERLSLAPGVEPRGWQVWMYTNGSTYYEYDVPDSDLREIQGSIAGYLAAKEPVKPKTRRLLRPALWMLAGMAVSTVGFVFGWRSVPPPPLTTGGAIDQLCLRPEIECSTMIRYVQPRVKQQNDDTDSDVHLSNSVLTEEQ